jgi:hypothetical protein
VVGLVTGLIRFTYNSLQFKITYNKSYTIIIYSITCKALNPHPLLSLITSICTAITTLRSSVHYLSDTQVTCTPSSNFQVEGEVEVTLRPTVSRPVRLGVGPPAFNFLCLTVTFLFFMKGSHPLMRGWVCNLQCDHSMVRVTQDP